MRFDRNWGRLDMKSEWRKMKFSDIVEFNPKESLPKGTISKKIGMDKLQPFCRDITEFEITEYTGGSKFRNGDTIMARITPCLENGKTSKVNILNDDEIGFGSTEYIVFRAKSGITDPDFIYYLVCSPLVREPAIKSMVGSSGRQRVQTDVIQKLEFAVPLFEEQVKIGSVLKALDDKIALNTAINDNLEQQAQAIFKQIFPYTIADDLPIDWRIGTAGEIIEFHDSKRIPLSGADRIKMEKKIYPYYGATSLMDYVDNYIFDGIYLLLGEDGTVVDDAGYPILQYVWGQFWVNNHAHILTGKLGFNVESLYLLFKQTPVNSIVTGAVQPKISQANLKSVPVVIPPKDILFSFNDQVEQLFKQIRVNAEQNQLLVALRDTLLPKLMSGDVNIADINI